jgi:hypothetical protein
MKNISDRSTVSQTFQNVVFSHQNEITTIGFSKSNTFQFQDCRLFASKRDNDNGEFEVEQFSNPDCRLFVAKGDHDIL